MKAYGEAEVKVHVLIILALDGSEWSVSRPGHFTSRERAPCAHWIGDWMTRADLDDVEKRRICCPCRETNPDSSAVQPVGRRNTDWNTPTLFGPKIITNNKQNMLYRLYNFILTQILKK
jgi:hypothetical protein